MPSALVTGAFAVLNLLLAYAPMAWLGGIIGASKRGDAARRA